MLTISAFSLVSLQVLQNTGAGLPQLLCATIVSCKKHPTKKHGTLQGSFLNLDAALVACMASSQWVTKLCFASSLLFRKTFGVLLSICGVSILPSEVFEEHLWTIFYCSSFPLVACRDRNWQLCRMQFCLAQSESLTVLICAKISGVHVSGEWQDSSHFLEFLTAAAFQYFSRWLLPHLQ